MIDLLPALAAASSILLATPADEPAGWRGNWTGPWPDARAPL